MLLALTATIGRATIIVWNGASTTFSLGTNWSGNVAPANDTLTDIASFGTVTVQPALVANTSVNGVQFTASNAVTLSGAFTLSLGNSGISNTSTSGTKMISSNLTLAASSAPTFTNNGVLTLSGTLANGGNLLTLSGSGAAGTLSGIISGTGGITVNSTGTWTLSGVNTFTGPVTLSSGTLNATTSAQALGTGAATLSLGGGTLNLANNTALSFARNTTVTAASNIVSDLLTTGAGVTHTLGTLSIGAYTLSVAAGGNVTSGTAGITFGATTLSATGSIFSAGSGSLLSRQRQSSHAGRHQRRDQ